MEQIIINHAAFILFMTIVLIVWVFSKYEPRMKLKLAELDILQQVQRLEADFESARDLEQLDRLEKFIETITVNAKGVVSDPQKFNDRLYRAYWCKHWDLINIEAPGIPQYLIPFITLK